jgi:hypothetical protein
MQLFRPTGLRELQLVLQSELRAWPPRLPEQPIFYPVLNVGYAEQIARDWNTKSDSRVGYVTEFWIDDAYAASFPRQVVGAGHHDELWVPAESLEEFNTHILSPIRVVNAFFGEGFTGLVPDQGGMRGQTANEQLKTLAGQFAYSKQDFHGEVTQNREAVFLHLPFWAACDADTLELAAPKTAVLKAVESVWSEAFPLLPLPLRAE